MQQVTDLQIVLTLEESFRFVIRFQTLYMYVNMSIGWLNIPVVYPVFSMILGVPSYVPSALYQFLAHVTRLQNVIIHMSLHSHDALLFSKGLRKLKFLRRETTANRKRLTAKQGQ